MTILYTYIIYIINILSINTAQMDLKILFYFPVLHYKYLCCFYEFKHTDNQSKEYLKLFKSMYTNFK